MRPYQYQGNLGKKVNHFRQARRLAMATSQAAGPLWEFRWGNTTDICVVNRVRLQALQIANATAEELRFNLKIARAFTVTDDTNTASIKRAADEQQLHGTAGATALTEFRESNVATAAAGGTKTLDTDGIVVGGFRSVGTLPTGQTNVSRTVFDFNSLDSGEELLRLGQDEGWVISLEVTKGATAGVVLYMDTSWSEIKPFTDV